MAEEKRRDLLQSVSTDLCSTFTGDIAARNGSEMSHFRGISIVGTKVTADLQEFSRLEEL